MARMVRPKVYRVGYTTIDREGLIAYLRYTNNQEFLNDIQDAANQGLSDGEILCSFYAKLCYKSLTLGQNKNVSRVRDIPDNVKGIIDTSHGSVLEHASVNFICTDCSRVFTHELVRHRIGTAFAQTSGRYVRGDDLAVIFDPILKPVEHRFLALANAIEDEYVTMCNLMGLNGRAGLVKAMTTKVLDDPGTWREAPPTRDEVEEYIKVILAGRPDPDLLEENSKLPGAKDKKVFDYKKQATSALRRLLPNGQANEIGFSINFRALRHIVQMRTAAGAEVEIRDVFAQVFHLVREKFPLIFYDAKVREVNGLTEVYGMRNQPYELRDGDPAALQFFQVSQLEAEIARRTANAGGVATSTTS